MNTEVRRPLKYSYTKKQSPATPGPLSKDKWGLDWLSIGGIFVMVYVVSYVVLPILAYWNATWVGVPALFDRGVLPNTIFWAVVGLAAFLHGYKFNCWYAGKLNHMSSHTFKTLSRVALRVDRLRLAWSVCVIATLVMFAKIVSDYGINTLVYDRGATFRGEGITLFTYLSLMTFSSVLSLLLFRLDRSKVILLFQSVFLLITSFGSRGDLACFLLAVGFVSRRGTEKSIFRWGPRLVVAVLLAVLTFGLVFARSSESVSGSAIRRAVVNTFEEGENFSLVYRRYKDRWLYGETIWDIRYIFLPRQLFPDKPAIYGKAIFERDTGLIYVYGGYNPYKPSSSSAFGQLSELYANFGPIGIILGMVCWGWIYAFVERLRMTPENSAGVFIYLTLYIYQFWFFRHGIQGAVQILVIPAILTPIFLKLVYYAKSPRFCPGSCGKVKGVFS